MQAPFEYGGSGETCIGCAATICAGDMVAPISADRPERLLCASCWRLHGSDLPLPSWRGRGGGRPDLAAPTCRASRTGLRELWRARVERCPRRTGA